MLYIVKFIAAKIQTNIYTTGKKSMDNNQYRITPYLTLDRL